MKTFIGVQDLRGGWCYIPIDKIMFIKSCEKTHPISFENYKEYKIFMHGGGSIQTTDDVPKLLEGKCTLKK